MFYKKNKEEKLSKELFKNPTSEYRGTPFWAWNCELNKELLNRQIDCLKEMGFGGFHMHSRAGMATPYLSKEFFNLVKNCVDKAKKEEMLAYLYDEDRWPSGAAGGLVTKDIRFRARHIEFTPDYIEDTVSLDEAYVTGKPSLLASYDIELDESGILKNYTRCSKGDNLWYMYFITDQEGNGWYNGQTYVDTLNNDAMDRFIDITYKSYKDAVGDEFGKVVPSIFTDEPQFTIKRILQFAHEKKTVVLPWTYDFADTFKENYGFDILDFFPEIIWENGDVSRARYCYHDHICERFVNAFFDNCGKWCEENDLMLTGHVVEEPSLRTQTNAIGEAMRCYRGFQIPGIDMLCESIELSTAKQCQSAVHQYGREAMMSELYGVSGWEFDFRGHKLHGDWQAALGVTIRVPHLSWVSMKGSAKRDYPASISYQSPWYKKYPLIEDHFSRLNTALTRGKPCVNVGVIHPLESYWINFGPWENTNIRRQELEDNFDNIINWLLFGGIDFDFISESILPELCEKVENPLSVGKMKYDAIVVPGLETIRKSTVEILEKFVEMGGKVIFMGDCPEYVDAVKADEVNGLYNKSVKINFSKSQLLNSLKSQRKIEIFNSNGTNTDNLIYNMRNDNDGDWLFIAHGKIEKQRLSVVESFYEKPQDITIKIKGEYTPVEYNTHTGDINEVSFTVSNGYTTVNYALYEFDSLLLKLMPLTKSENTIIENQRKLIKKIDFKEMVEYQTEESNVYLLDMAKYSVDNKELQPIEELLKIDLAVRKELGFVKADGFDVQPWCIEKEKPEHFVNLEFEIESEIEVKDVYLAFEEAAQIEFNGKSVDIEIVGWYVDESINKIKLGTINKGINTLKVKVPITNRLSLENMFILGDFDVKVQGTKTRIVQKSNKITFGSIVNQGLPFYGGNIIYETEIETPDCDLEIQANHYKGALLGVILDNEEEKNIIFSPYKAIFENVKAGKHKIKFIYYGNRYNTFGALHRNSDHFWKGPAMWYTEDCKWSYEYILANVGIMKSPVIRMFESK